MRPNLLNEARELDSCDALAPFAAEFAKPEGQIYLDGNSLGLLGRSAELALQTAIDSWRQHAILGWTEGDDSWFGMARQAAALLAPILGASPEDVMVGQSTTVNLHQALATFYDPAGSRPKILIDSLSFPSDRYAVESHLRLRGRNPVDDLVVVASEDGHTLSDDAIFAAMDRSVGFALLPSVLYRSGQLLDLPALTQQARERGVMIAWDCSHSAGVVPHQFRKEDIDLAFGCTYKYLNGGPGSVGFLYVHPRWQARTPGLAGWFGCDPARQFAMESAFHPAADASRFLIGTPHVLSLAPLLGSLAVVSRAGLFAIRHKSLTLTAFLRGAIEERLTHFGIRVVTPNDDKRRGGHLTLAHASAGKLSQALRTHGVIPDYRPPDLLRLAPSPLYTTFEECLRAVDILEELLITNAIDQLPDQHAAVT